MIWTRDSVEGAFLRVLVAVVLFLPEQTLKSLI